MRRNLATRGLSLPGAVFPTPDAQAGRFLAESLGPAVFDRAGAKSLWEIRESVVLPTELRRWVHSTCIRVARPDHIALTSRFAVGYPGSSTSMRSRS